MVRDPVQIMLCAQTGFRMSGDHLDTNRDWLDHQVLSYFFADLTQVCFSESFDPKAPFNALPRAMIISENV